MNTTIKKTIVALGLLLAAGGAQAVHYAVTDLGTLPGGNLSYAYGINARGQVVGYSTTTTEGRPEYAFMWTNGVMANIDPGGNLSYAYGINASGQVVGEAYTADWYGYAFVRGSDGGITDLGTIFISPSAHAINASGQVVGYGIYPGPGGWDTHAFVWSSGAGMVDLNSLIDANSGWTVQTAVGINDKGQIVGGGYGSASNNAGRALLLTPLPTSKDQCKNGGWQTFGLFKNQGQCIQYVNTGR